MRICAAGALGQIGTKAAAAVDPLLAAAADPALRAEAAWALERITGKEPTFPADQPDPVPVTMPRGGGGRGGSGRR